MNGSLFLECVARQAGTLAARVPGSLPRSGFVESSSPVLPASASASPGAGYVTNDDGGSEIKQEFLEYFQNSRRVKSDRY